MPILPKCKFCGREGRYAEKESDSICAQCKKARIPSKKAEQKEDPPGEEKKG